MLADPYEVAKGKVICALENECCTTMAQLDINPPHNNVEAVHFQPGLILGAFDLHLDQRISDDGHSLSTLTPCIITIDQTETGSLISILKTEVVVIVQPCLEDSPGAEAEINTNTRVNRVVTTLEEYPFT